MSEIRVNELKSEDGTGAPTAPNGLNVVGVCTATSFVGSGANLTGISAGMSLVGVTTISPGTTNITTIDFTSLDPDSFYHMNGYIKLQSSHQFQMRGQFRNTNGNSLTDFGSGGSYVAETRTFNSNYGNQTSSYWYWYNNYSTADQLWIDVKFSTHVYPWIQVRYGGVTSGYQSFQGSGNGIWSSNMSTTKIEGIQLYNSSGYYYDSPTRIHLYKLQTTQ
tara:strand:+ start:175 stop:834 length:660 start_codon:yes stop_codon:yes gene_type:complete